MARSNDLTRTLDSVAGGVLAPLAGPLLNRARALPARARRIGIVQPTAIGDTLISSGAVAAIAARYPDAALTVYHGAGNGGAVKMLAVPVERVQTSFANPLKGAAALRRAALDLVVDLTPWPHATAFAARLAAPVTVGFVPAGSSRGRLFDLAVPHRTDRHELDNMAELAALFGHRGAYAMRIARVPLALPAGLGLELGRLVLCHLSPGGSRAADKAWPVASWARLVRHLVGAGFQVGFTGVAADSGAVDAVLAAAGLGPGPDVVSLCGRLSLVELAELLAAVPLLVTVDTGVLHLAAAVDGRSLGLHGPTLPARWGSRSPRARSLVAAHPAAGYINYGYERAPGGVMLMHELAPETVIAAAEEMLEAPR